jgi:hypothetical protein
MAYPLTRVLLGNKKGTSIDTKPGTNLNNTLLSESCHTKKGCTLHDSIKKKQIWTIKKKKQISGWLEPGEWETEKFFQSTQLNT